MRKTTFTAGLMIVALFALAFTTVASQAADPLPSWNDGPAKQSIIAFVEKVTKPGSPDFVPVPERIATFDNDGTLWCEQPMPVQLYFAFDRVKALAPRHPGMDDAGAIRLPPQGRFQGALAGGDHALLELVMATHAGMTTKEFEQIVKDWIATARHPKTGKLYTEMVYQPMLEVLAYLRANGFKNFIVSGGGIEFMRPWAEQVYGIPPEQVVGSSIKTQFEMRDGKAVLVRLPELNFNDDKERQAHWHQPAHRPPAHRRVRQFPRRQGNAGIHAGAAAARGSNCWCCTMMRRANTPTVRRWDCRTSKLGAFPQALYDQAKKEGWTVVSMKNDWRQVFPFEPQRSRPLTSCWSRTPRCSACRREQRPPARRFTRRVCAGCGAHARTSR